MKRMEQYTVSRRAPNIGDKTGNKRNQTVLSHNSHCNCCFVFCIRVQLRWHFMHLAI